LFEIFSQQPVLQQLEYLLFHRLCGLLQDPCHLPVIRHTQAGDPAQWLRLPEQFACQFREELESHCGAMRAAAGRQLAADGLTQHGQAQALQGPALKDFRVLRAPVLPSRGAHQCQRPESLRYAVATKQWAWRPSILQRLLQLLQFRPAIRNSRSAASRTGVVSKAHSAVPAELYNQDGTARSLYDPHSQDKDSCGVGFVGGKRGFKQHLRRIVKGKRELGFRHFQPFSDHPRTH
jgi:hypothetical protein